MIKILKENHNAILIFILPIILVSIGLAVYRDFGISLDEEITRQNGLVTIKYIYDFLFTQNAEGFELVSNLPELETYWQRQYGTFFEVIVISIIEIVSEIKSFSEVFYYRHLMNHLLFLISIFCFYFLCLNIFKNKLYAFFGAAVLYTTPRIFAESFYNSKDLAFLSFFIFSIFFSIKFIKKANYYNAFLLSIFLGLSTNLRIVGFYLGILVILFFLIEFLMKNKIDKEKINILIFLFFFQLVFLYISWPFLWESPIHNFIYTLTSTQDASRSWGGHVFYLGNFYQVAHLPWHYPIVHFVATTPILISILIGCGFIQLSLRFFKRLINIDGINLYKDIWRGEKEKIFLFLFFIIFIPIFIIFLADTIIYNSWRHLFFLYPPLILILVYFLENISKKFRKRKISFYVKAILAIILINNIYNQVNLHPFQYIYFNSLFEKNANKLFEIDYWGLSNKQSLEVLVKNNLEEDRILIGVASFTDLNLSRKMLDKKYKDRISITGQDFNNADFIFSNNHFEVNPNLDNKYLIPKNFQKYTELKKGNILINEFYIKE